MPPVKTWPQSLSCLLCIRWFLLWCCKVDLNQVLDWERIPKELLSPFNFMSKDQGMDKGTSPQMMMRRQRRRRIKHWPSQSLIYINPFQFVNMPSRRTLGKESVAFLKRLILSLKMKSSWQDSVMLSQERWCRTGTPRPSWSPELLGRRASFFAYLNRW